MYIKPTNKYLSNIVEGKTYKVKRVIVNNEFGEESTLHVSDFELVDEGYEEIELVPMMNPIYIRRSHLTEWQFKWLINQGFSYDSTSREVFNWKSRAGLALWTSFNKVTRVKQEGVTNVRI